ncbi:hypothetical protein IVB69_05360 [Flavobacterium sp. J49]|uniref:hypothetical protein n=1 Tax=Flavobacterium sp. J49 TaxID=2718534 RepID=UPI0015931208|nr:hypothetical protein [Flavobacterium sp. J49]MBF6640898.1 hypothetical protein [Flavobacterium sp. J49]NIC02145.1 hypothetical protein [Flavobacterium sp. J49]
MKKILFLLLLTLSFSGCENDDTDYIVGEWKVEKVLVDNTFTSDGLIECDLNTIYIFRSDKKFLISGPQVTNDGYLCMLLGADQWRKTDNGYSILNDTYSRSEIIKVSKDTIVMQNIDGYPTNFKKMLVRQ